MSSLFFRQPRLVVATTQRHAQELGDQLRRVTGTDKVTLYGEVNEEVQVSVEASVLQELGMGVEQISRAIEQADTKLRAGSVRTQSSRFIIELSENLEILEQVQDVIVLAADGSAIRLGDIAQVSKSCRQPVSEVALVSGRPAVIGSIGVSINAAIVILTGLQNNEQASLGNTSSMVDAVMGSSRHIISTTVTTFGGFLPLILAGGGFWPPFAMSIAGDVLLSTVISFYFTPPMFSLVHQRQWRQQRAASQGTN